MGFWKPKTVKMAKKSKVPSKAEKPQAAETELGRRINYKKYKSQFPKEETAGSPLGKKINEKKYEEELKKRGFAAGTRPMSYEQAYGLGTKKLMGE